MSYVLLPATQQLTDEAARQNFEYIESHVVFKQGVPWVIVDPPSGDVTGVTDATAISTAAATLLALGGKGVLQFLYGTYYDNTQRNWDQSLGVELWGLGGQSPGDFTATVLRYTGSTVPYISARSSFSFRVKHMMVEYTNAAFVGPLFDFSHVTATDTAYTLFDDCTLAGAGIRTALLIFLEKSIITTFRDVAFQNGTYAVQGLTNTVGSYCNVVSFEGNCSFNGFVNPPILNPGQCWSFKGSTTFEPLSNGDAGAVASSLGGIVGFSWDGVWCGDSSTGLGTWIDMAMSGSSIKATYFGSGHQGVNLHASSSGTEVSGNTFSGTGAHNMAVGIGVGANCTNLKLEPNFYTLVTQPMSLATLPLGSSYTDNTGTRRQSSQLWCRDGVATMTANTTGLTSAQIDALFAQAPVDGMHLVDPTNLVALERLGGKWYKTGALTLIP